MTMHLTLSMTKIARKHLKPFYSCIFLLGAAKGLFEEGYYISMKEAVRPNGIICCQGTVKICKQYTCNSNVFLIFTMLVT